MEIENIELANKAVKELRIVQNHLDLVLAEIKKMEQQSANSHLMLKIDGFELDITGHRDLQEEILEKLLHRYSEEKQKLIAQIKSY